MPGLQITKDRVNEAEEFLLQYLRDAGYAGSLEDGTGVYDVLVKGFSLLYAMFQQQVDKSSAYLSLTRAEELKDLLGDEYDTAVDAVLSNWFVSRKSGRPSYGTVRLWFSKPLDYLHIKAGDQLVAFGGNLFTATAEYIFTPESFELVINKPQNKEEYFVEVTVSSVENVQLLIEEGDAFDAYVNNIYFLRAEAASSFITGVDKESSEDFIVRTEQAITTRELITSRAINTVLTERFDDIKLVEVAGHGDFEQVRDVKTFAGVSVHVGNKADIFLRAPYIRATKEISVAEGVSIDLDVELIAGAQVAHVLSVTDTGSGVAVPFTVLATEEDWGRSVTRPIINVPGPGTYKVEYLSQASVNPVTQFVFSEMQRVACYDPYVKSMYPVLLEFDLHMSMKSGSVADQEDKIKLAVVQYVTDIAHKEAYTESAFIEHMHRSIPGIRSIRIPLNTKYSLFDPKKSSYVTGICSPEFFLPGDTSKSQQITNRTTCFYTDKNLITLNDVD